MVEIQEESKEEILEELNSEILRQSDARIHDIPVEFRGDGPNLASVNLAMQNFMLVLGSKPGEGVPENSTMIKDVMSSFAEFYDKQTLTVEFPRILNQLKGNDSNIEIITSSMLQPLKMNIVGFPMADSRVFILV